MERIGRFFVQAESTGMLKWQEYQFFYTIFYGEIMANRFLIACTWMLRITKDFKSCLARGQLSSIT